jgi:hypothetical protein
LGVPSIRKEIDMNSTDIHTPRATHRVPTNTVIAVLALIFAAIAALEVVVVVADGAISGLSGDYFEQVGKALGGG